MAFDLFTPGHASSSSRPARASSSHAPASTTNGHKDSAAEDDGNDEDDIEVAYLRPQAYGNGDKAVWKLLDRHGAEAARVPVPGRIPRDVDTWEDYAQIAR